MPPADRWLTPRPNAFQYRAAYMEGYEQGRAAALDVERLARALKEFFDIEDNPFFEHEPFDREAAAIAAAYEGEK